MNNIECANSITRSLESMAEQLRELNRNIKSLNDILKNEKKEDDDDGK